MIRSWAPGKIILFGEHAVVYGRPAVAAPVDQVRATAQVEAGPAGGGVTLVARDLGQVVHLAQAAPDDPLAVIARDTLRYLGQAPPDAIVTVTSSIPIASGLGSGAAVATAVARALAAFVGGELSPAEVSRLVYEVERIHHGTPSGIDNTVVAYGQPVYFVRQQRPERFRVGRPLHFLIADSGIASPTREVVAAVRAGWEEAPERYERLFDAIGALVDRARRHMQAGQARALGPLLTENHRLLQEMGVSSPVLDRLVDAALGAGAGGAKLSGAGRGGNVIALVDLPAGDQVKAALQAAGARRVIATTVR
jgi:mevalonate kinase